MAIKWSGTSGHLQLGVELSQSPAVVTENTSQVTVTAAFFVRTADGWGHNSNGTLNFTGSAGGSQSFRYDVGIGAQNVARIATKTRTVTLSYTGSQSVTFGGYVSGWWNGAAPRVDASWSVPARPTAAPYTPSSGSAVRVSDAQANLSWSVSSDAGHPIHSIHVERRQNGSGWVRVANLPASARSWSDTGITANNVYDYQVFAYNGRSSGQRALGTVVTTPAPPRDVAATRQANGVIRVTWTAGSSIPASGYEVYDNGSRIAVTSGSASHYDHSVRSESGQHRYTIKQKTSNGLTSVESAVSNTVNLAGPPNPPTLTGAVGDTQAVGAKPNMSWVHNPVDASSQTAYQVRYRKNSAGWVTSPITSSTTAEYANAPILQPGVYEWQVRTWGTFKSGQETGASPWSPVASFRAATVPVIGLPYPPDTLQSAKLAAYWTYSQAENGAQTEVELQLLRGGQLIEEKKVTGTSTLAVFSTILGNDSQWFLRIRAKSSQGLWSDWVEKSFTVRYPAPHQPVIEATWHDEMGGVAITVTNPKGGSTPTVVSNSLYRKIGDNDWELVTDNLESGFTYLERTCLTHGVNEYRVEAFTELGAKATSETTVEVHSPKIWLNWGPGLESILSLEMRPNVQRNGGLKNRVIHHFAGRPRGVEYAGIQREKIISFSGLVSSFTQLQGWEEATLQPGPFLYRDFHGERIFCTLTDFTANQFAYTFWSIQAKIEEIDYDEKPHLTPPTLL